MLSMKATVLVAPARAFVETVLRGMEIAKGRLESIILFKNDFRISVEHLKKKKKNKLLHRLFLLYVNKCHQFSSQFYLCPLSTPLYADDLSIT